MAVYRVYVLDEAGRVAGPPHILDCADDDEAALRARQYLDGQVVEVWAGARLVIALKPGSEPA
ncbi:hypothetical protein JQ633_28310 [Bradyrhizobium tropiciagri]|uniref:hypothetical protein n=1 Tax=Bradyrhizobium tropiciagri TaxID=312253 RepID=UPI001BA72EF9|nr:hypothetical protein [Bradyrhizobium tropiciagri]MBR0874289.1 hypothetical protein [Bradyrhizobium tropiciagri]